MSEVWKLLAGVVGVLVTIYLYNRGRTVDEAKQAEKVATLGETVDEHDAKIDNHSEKLVEHTVEIRTIKSELETLREWRHEVSNARPIRRRGDAE